MTQAPQPKRSPHLRLSAEQIKAKWLLGDYTAQGYLFDLIKALRKDGWHLPIDDVDAFCEQWAISRRSFYRAKARLILQGRIEEKIIGRVELWIEPNSNIVPFREGEGDPSDDNPGTGCAKFGTGDDNPGTDGDNPGTATPFKPLPDERSQPPSDLLQISDHLSLSFPPSLQPERGNLNFNSEIKEFASGYVGLETENQQPTTPNQQPTKTSKDPIQVPPRGDDEFLNFVLKTEVLTLPHPPATEPQQRRLARRLIDRDRDVGDLSRAFEKWQRQQAEIASRWSEAGSVRPEVSLPQTRTLGSELVKLQAFFESSRLANNGTTKAMRETAIARALQLGFVVSDVGIELAPGQKPEQEVSSCANG